MKELFKQSTYEEQVRLMTTVADSWVRTALSLRLEQVIIKLDNLLYFVEIGAF